MKVFCIIIFLPLIFCQNASGGIFRDFDRQIREAKNEATQARENAAKQKVEEGDRRKAAKVTKIESEKFRAEELEIAAKRENRRLQSLQQTKQLKVEAKKLVEKNAGLQTELKNRENDLNEIKLQLEAEQLQLQLEKDANSKAALALKTEKEELEERSFLYSMGFWSSLGAIMLGLMTLVLRLPTLRLEREKLRNEIQLLAKQLDAP